MKLVLIDSHAILHRAYHALPPLTSPDGTVINAIYGFTTMLLTILETQKPTHLVTAFDLPAPTFRQQLYTAYQGKRPEMEGNLVDQIPLVKEMLDALSIQRFEVAGFEADDVIGTLAKQAVGELKVEGRKLKFEIEGRNLKLEEDRASKFNSQNRPSTVDHLSFIDVIIVTGDRDMLQLVNGHVSVLVPVKGLKETKLYHRDAVISEFGVTPEQWVDVKALKGDPSDNYSGVAGIGPKTALELIGTYGNLEELYRNLGKLNPKTAAKLAEGAEGAGMAKKLAQIVTDVPTVHLDLEKARVDQVDWGNGVDYMRNKLGFKTIVQRIKKTYLNKTNQTIKAIKSKDEEKENGPSSVETSAGKQMKLI